jgi:hypothetical protein
MSPVQALVDALGVIDHIEAELLLKSPEEREAAAKALLAWIDTAVAPLGTGARTKAKTAVARYALTASAHRLAMIEGADFGAVRRDALTKMCTYAPDAQMWGHALGALPVDEHGAVAAAAGGFAAIEGKLTEDFAQHLKKIVVNDKATKAATLRCRPATSAGLW